VLPVPPVPVEVLLELLVSPPVPPPPPPLLLDPLDVLKVTASAPPQPAAGARHTAPSEATIQTKDVRDARDPVCMTFPFSPGDETAPPRGCFPNGKRERASKYKTEPDETSILHVG
jgi:hypothetical protein